MYSSIQHTNNYALIINSVEQLSTCVGLRVIHPLSCSIYGHDPPTEQPQFIAEAADDEPFAKEQEDALHDFINYHNQISENKFPW